MTKGTTKGTPKETNSPARPATTSEDEDQSPAENLLPAEGPLPEESEIATLLTDLGEFAPATTGSEVVKYDALQSYLAELRNLPTLTREEELELALRFQKHGDQMAGYKLVLANLRLVVIIAREYQRNFQNILDLIQEGNIGLLEAVKQFDPLRGIRFPSYAVYWIRAYMLRYIINNLRLVKIGTTQAQRKLFFNLKKEKEKLEAEGFIPEAKLLANRLNVKESEVLEMEQRLSLPDLSVDAPLNSEEGNLDMHGVLADPNSTSEELVVREQFSSAIREAIAEISEELDDKERMIVDRRLAADEPATLQEIADEFNVSRERIRQIEARLKEKLKAHLAAKLNLGNSGDVILENGES